ncbi:MAG: heparinase II/III family protein [Gemmatimonadaceae bacterium]|jgi:hypothetical protein|nr:heparinase II/III family protein [Gemmatimonadaceae bacterium]
MNRRRFAKAIRARQECFKLLQRLRATVPSHTDELALLRAEAPALLRAAPGGRGLADAVRHASPVDAPWRRRGSPPDLEALLREAQHVARGAWTVFGQPLSIPPDGPAWRTHPRSGVETALVPFSRVPLTGEAVGGDVKPLWEINRHAELVRLAQAWALTHDPHLAETLLRWLDRWWDQNPPGFGVNYAAVLEVAFRAIAWSWIWRLTADAPAWTDERVARLLHHVHASAEHIVRFDSVHHSPNTHLTGEGLGLLVLGATFPQMRRAARWRTIGREILLSEIDEQWLPDGFHYERATYYHRYHLEFYLHARATLAGTDGTLATRADPWLVRGLEALMQMRRPDGGWPVFGDADGGSTLRLWAGQPDDPCPLLVLGAATFGREEWLHGMSPSSHALAWWMADDAQWQWLASAQPATPQRTHWALDATGYFGARDAWTPESWYVAVDAGPHGGDCTGHAHTDLGHVEIGHGADPVIVDPGSLIYGADEARRDFDRALRSHATLIIGNDALAEPRGPFGWRRIAPEPTRRAGEADGLWSCWLDYLTPSGTRHRRQVVLVPRSGVVVLDVVTAPAATPLEWHWPLADGDVPLRQPATLPLAVRGAEVHVACSTPLDARLERFDRAPSYARRAAATSLRATALAHDPVTIAVWAFTLPGGRPSLAVETGVARATLRDADGVAHTLSFTSDGVLHSTSPAPAAVG